MELGLARLKVTFVRWGKYARFVKVQVPILCLTL